jgi:hypothetical protein
MARLVKNGATREKWRDSPKIAQKTNGKRKLIAGLV